MTTPPPDASASAPSDAAAPPPRRVFLSYSRKDTDAVLAVQGLLHARGIPTFLDRDQLVAGMPWPQALEKGLSEARAVAVFLGPSGMGLWQKREMGFALDRQVAAERTGDAFPVVPVLLDGADPSSGFLFLNTWVDLRKDVTDAAQIEALAHAVAGRAAGAAQSDESLASLCPYRGLRPFREEDAAFFFGREALAARLLDAVVKRDVVAVIGPSGSGKSSVIDAGLLPLLRRRRVPAPTWDAVTFVPGDRPFHNVALALVPHLEAKATETERLAAAKSLGDKLRSGDVALDQVVRRLLEASGGTDRLLLAVDQFEELFTLTPPDERAPFLAALFGATGRAPATVLLALRASFYGTAIAADRALAECLEKGSVNVGPMTGTELETAISAPAKRVGLVFEDGLAPRLLDDVGDEPGNLPFLEFALTELWARRQGRRLTHAAYDAIGGVAGAIAKRADTAYDALSEAQREIARRVFTRLVWTSEDALGGGDARRRAKLSDLGADARPVVEALAEAHLVVVSRQGPGEEDTVDVAHDALIRQWTRLREWLNADRQFLLWQNRLRGTRDEWLRAARHEDTLLRGPPLAEAEYWLQVRGADFTPDETEFVRASVALRERQRLARERRRRWVLFSSLSTAVVSGALLLLVFYLGLQSDAEQVATNAQDVETDDPETGILVALEAARLARSESTRRRVEGVLRDALVDSHVRARLEVPGTIVFDARFSPEGRRVVTAGSDRLVRVWEWKDGSAEACPTLHEIAQFAGHTDVVLTAAWAPDGLHVVTGSKDGTARIWEAGSGRAIRTLVRGKVPVWDAEFDAGGRNVVTACADGTVCVWDAATGEAQGAPVPHPDSVSTAVFSPDGAEVLTACDDGFVRRTDWRTGTPAGAPIRHDDGRGADVGDTAPAPASCAAWSADGRLVVTAGADNLARIWRLPETPGPQARAERVATLSGQSDTITCIAFSSDARYVAASSRTGEIRVWQEEGGAWHHESVLRGHRDGVNSVRFCTPGGGARSADAHARADGGDDGPFVVSAARDGTARVWDARQEPSLHLLRGHRSSVDGASFSADGSRVLAFSSDGDALVWKVREPSAPPERLVGHTDSISFAEFDPADSGRVVTASWDRTARIWGGAKPLVLSGHQVHLHTARFSRDGRWVVTASNDHTARVWDAATGRCIAILGGLPGDASTEWPAASAMHEGVLSADGGLVLRSRGAEAWVADTSDPRAVRQLRSGEGKLAHDLTVTGGAFSPDARRVATASQDHTARIWDCASGALLRTLGPHDGAVTDVAWSADGKWIATSSLDRTARVWDAESGAARWTLGHVEPVAQATFSPDGAMLVTLTDDGAVTRWRLADGEAITAPGSANGTAGHTERVFDAQFHPDGKHVVTASGDGTARIWDWDPPPGRCLRVLRGHTRDVRTAAFSPDGERVVTASDDGTARIWDTRTGVCLHVLSGHLEAVTKACFSPDGTRVATASADTTARVWDAATGACVCEMFGHVGAVSDVAFDAKGERVATASEDTTARVWDAATGDPVAVLDAHDGWVRSVAFSPYGNLVITASRDRTARVWGLGDLSCYCRPGLDGLVPVARSRVTRSLTEGERHRFLPWALRGW